MKYKIWLTSETKKLFIEAGVIDPEKTVNQEVMSIASRNAFNQLAATNASILIKVIRHDRP